MMRLSVHPSRPRALLAAGAAVSVLGLAPSAAGAATVSAGVGELTYAAAAGEANHVTIAPWSHGLKVTETGTRGTHAIKLTVGTGCWRLSTSEAVCANSASPVAFDGGNGDDYLDASKLTTPLTASGGAGDDTFLVRDGTPDSVQCGDGSDAATADFGDSVADDCEAVLLPELPVEPGTTDPGTTDPGTTDPGTTDPGTTDPGVIDPDPDDPGDPDDPDADPGDPAPGAGNAVPPSIPPQTVGVSASGVATVLIACPVDSGGCRGTVTIELPRAAKKRGRAKIARVVRGRAIKLGRAKFKAAAGTSKTVRVRLSKRGRQRILRGRRTRARITVTTRSATGGTSVTSQDVTLRPRARARARARGTKVHKP
jgi:hypothetical protein